MPLFATASPHNAETAESYDEYQESSSSTSTSSSSSSASSSTSPSPIHSLKASFPSIREKARDAQSQIRHGLGEISTLPEEDHAGDLSAAKQRAVDQMKVRRRAATWLNSGQDGDDDGERGGKITEEAVAQGGMTPFQASIQGQSSSITNEVDDEEEEEEESAVSTAFLVSYFVAGGAAGATSRTVVSPLERLKIIMQVQPKSSRVGAGSKGAYSGVLSGLGKMWHEEGFKGFMRGNGINCLRIVPYSAVQFSTYEILKNALTDDQGGLDTVKRLTAGAIAGIASVVSTYPLDLVRSRISIASASLYAEAKKSTMQVNSSSADSSVAVKPPRKPTRAEVRKAIEERQKRVPGIWAMTAKVYREEGGFRALYKGCVPTSAGVAPYVAINFAAYEGLRKRLADEEGEISTLRKLSCGACAGSISQTLTYPLDVLRRRMQVSGMKDSKLGYSDKSSFAAIKTIVQAEGIFGLYRGITPNLLKVAPSIATSFCCYEFVCNLIHPPHHHGHHSTHH